MSRLASLVMRLTSSTFFLTWSTQLAKRPPPQRGRIRSSASETFSVIRLTSGNEVRSYSS